MTDRNGPVSDRPSAKYPDALHRCRQSLAKLKDDVAVWSSIRAFPPLAVIAALNGVAGLVLLRKFSGGAPLSLTNGRLCFVACAVALLTIGARWLLCRIERMVPALWLRTVLMVLCLSPLVVLLATVTSRQAPWAVSFTSALAVATGCMILLWKRQRSPRSGTSDEGIPSGAWDREPRAAEALCSQPPDPIGCQSTNADRSADEWTERFADESGQMTFRGQVMTDFAAGQSIATVHIPFFPAFTGTPDFACEVIDAQAVRARTPAVYRYGARVELKRAGDTSHPARVQIRFRASTAGTASRAA